MKRTTNDAVSPVVGVMLMLVVTIIIAAIVSAFAGGLGGSQKSAPQATIVAEQDIQGIDGSKGPSGITYPTGFTAKNGILFENTGGDSFSLDSINIQITGGGTSYTITPDDKINSAGTCLPSDISAYLLKIGSTSSSDKTISPGDKFMFYADGCYIYYNGVKYLVWHPEGAVEGIGIPFGQKTEYAIIDRDTSKVISNGYILFK